MVSVDPEEPDSDAICSISEDERGNNATAAVFQDQLPYNPDESWDVALVIIQKEIDPTITRKLDWMAERFPSEKQSACDHAWTYTVEIKENAKRICLYCRLMTLTGKRAHCTECDLTLCPLCAKWKYGLEIRPGPEEITTAAAQYQHRSKDSLIEELYRHNISLLKENQLLRDENERLRNRLQEGRLQEWEPTLAREFEELSARDQQRSRDKGK